MPAHRADRSRRGRRPSWAPAAAAGSLSLVLAALVLVPAPRHDPVRIEFAGGAPETSATAGTAPGTAPPSGAPVPAGTPGADPAPAAPATGAPSPPARLLIPRIGVDAPVESGGLNPDGTVEVPPADRPGQVDWYREGPVPGGPGPAVILGHYDTRKGPAVFHRLPQLRPGDRIDVRGRNGGTVSFKVRELQQFPKSGFPTATVYGDTAGPELRLVTCGGRVGADGHYSDNIIVLADYAGTTPPTG